ncbi:MAG: NAD-dependent epimerase/dehydratase family protein [Chloroflexi bacterium]|nr:MAG: NAD-dependent epimerase/dehydratase family protein [Chloroflexota bacterium]
MKALVTGGAGFIGSHLTKALVTKGYDVRVLDNLSTGSRENLEGVSVELIEGDIADWEVVKTAVSGCALVFHEAALVSVPKSIEEPALNHASNVTGTFHVFEAARLANVRRVVYATSAAVYGDLPGLPKRETDPLQMKTPYAMAKRTSELLAMTYNSSYGMELVGLRYMNVYGPRQDPSSPYSGVLSIFCRNVLADKPLFVYGDGEQTRDFVYVADVVQANILAATVDLSGLDCSPIFNVGNGKQTSLNQIIDILSEINGQPIEKSYGPARAGDIKHSVGDINRAQQHLNFHPATTLLDGLKATFEWFR